MAKDMKSHYDILGVSPHADFEVIKAAYRAMSQKYHPDLNGGGAAATAKMAEINHAWQVLSSPIEKSRYDDNLFAQAPVKHGLDEREDEEDNAWEPHTSEVAANFVSERPAPPEKARYLGVFEYVAIGLFGLITAFVMLQNEPAPYPKARSALDPSTAPTIPMAPVSPARTHTVSSPPPSTNTAIPTVAAKTNAAPNGTPWPSAAGLIAGYRATDFGGSVINLANLTTLNAFYVKLINSSRGARSPSRYLYVGPNQQFSIVNVAPGKYWLEFQDIMTEKHYRTAEFSLSEGISAKDATRLQYTTVGFEFSRSGDGYLDTRQIPAREFGAE
jgi:hypothetical protein